MNRKVSSMEVKEGNYMEIKGVTTIKVKARR
jgi:hypothetical protein